MKKILIISVTSVLLMTNDAFAVLQNNNILDNVTSTFQTAAAGWGGAISSAANWLFWVLVVISMVWTFGFMALRKADIGEFFAEFIKFILFVGFFKWILDNGTNFGADIISSLRIVAANAAGVRNEITPSGIVDLGFDICFKIIDNTSFWSPADSLGLLILGVIILIILTLIAVNMLVLLCSGYFLLYAGIFFLGFGGSKWTCDMAINYYKTVLNVGIQLFAMILIIGTGQTILDTYHSQMSTSLPFKELVVMLVVAIVLYTLVTKVPSLLASIVTGGLGGAAGGSAITGGALLGGASVGASMLASGVGAVGGGASALKAAIAASGGSGGSGDPVSNLAKGAKQVVKDSMNERLSQTTGGKIAAAIKDNMPSKKKTDK